MGPVVAVAPDLGTALDGVLLCLVDALEASGRAVCGSGITVGSPVLGPTACCEDCACGGPGGQLSGQLVRLYPADSATFGQQVRIENCVPGAVAADLAFTLARCHPVINEKGVPPSLDAVAPFADGALDDAQIMWLAFQCGCIDGLKVVIRDISVQAPPEGGCSAVGVSITVLVKPARPVVDVS